jgi:hypothetical protein
VDTRRPFPPLRLRWNTRRQRPPQRNASLIKGPSPGKVLLFPLGSHELRD